MLKPIRINCGVYSVSIIIIHQLMMEGSPVQPSVHYWGMNFDYILPAICGCQTTFPCPPPPLRRLTRHPVSGAVGCQYTHWHVKGRCDLDVSGIEPGKCAGSNQEK